MSLYDNASLVMIPSGYKDDKLFSIKPTDGSGDFTFSRDGSGASPATRVNASGLIEKGRENVLLQSNQFDTTWSLVNANLTSGQSGYDGSSNAWLLSVAATTGSTASVRQTTSITAVSTFSVYAKAGNVNFAALYCSSSGSDFNAWFDLGNGVLGSTAGGTIDTTIESVGGGWYRISITGLSPDSQVRIYPSFANSNYSITSGENIYIQDAQLEQGLVATDYIETTTAPVSAGLLGDMPRLDYSGGATCPSLLLEPSMVNLVPNSEHFAASTWIVTATLTPNAGISPEGVQNAYNIAANSGLGNGITDVINIPTSGVAYTSTIYYKSAGATTGSWRLFDGSTGGSTTITLEPTSEWKRAEITRTAGASTTQLRIDLFNNDGDLLIYGAQVEAGSYPTSYIPTYGSASTRGDDFCSKTSITSLIGQSEGAAYIEFDPRSGTGERRFFLQIGSGSTTIYARIESGGTLTAQILNSGTDYLTSTGTSISSGTNKFAVAYANNDAVFYLNGTQLATSSSVIVPALSALYVGSNSSGAQQIGGDVKQSVLFKTRLTNAELASLTTI